MSTVTHQLTIKRLTKICLALLVTASVIPAQTGNAPKTTSKTSTPPESTAKVPPSKADQLREYQLRVLREHVLARVVESIKKMDQAGLRLSARDQVLTCLASDNAPSNEKEALTTQLAIEAVTDLRDHGAEILPFMFSYLSSSLGSWIQKHRPNLTEDFDKAVKAHANVDASQRIRSLFDLKGGDVLAAKRIRQELQEQGAVNGLHFWLDELMRRKSNEFEPLASYIITSAEQGQISFETLFWVSDIYLRSQTSDALRNRFLTMVVARTQPANFTAEPAPQMAYDLLTKVLPSVQRLIPELHDQALNQLLAIRAALNERQLATDLRIKRLKESANPVEDLVSEAESAKSKTQRNELMLQAAQLALQKKRFEFCLDILGNVDVNVAAAEPDLWQRSIDQILKKFVSTVLADGRVELGEKAAARIGSSLARVQALNLIMRYFAKVNDKADAQRLLTEAAKVAASTPNETEKAKAFFLLSVTCDQVDASKKAGLVLSGINALNNLAEPDPGARDKTIHQSYIERLNNTGYELIKGFKALTAQDENDALALVEKLQKRDLRTFALIGILLALDGPLTEPA